MYNSSTYKIVIVKGYMSAVMSRLRRVIASLVLAGLFCAASSIAFASEDVLLVDVEPGQPHSRTYSRGTAPQNVQDESARYIITFMDADNIFEEAICSDTDPVTPPSGEPEREGFVFLYWVESNSASIPFSFGMPTIGNLTLTAVYAEIPHRSENQAPVPSFPPHKTDKKASEPLADKPSEEDTAVPVYILEYDDPELPGCSIRVYTTHTDIIVAGQIIQLWAEVSGFEGLDVSFRWQYYTDGEWHDVENATSLTHAFVATPETVNYSWQLVASVTR